MPSRAQPLPSFAPVSIGAQVEHGASQGLLVGLADQPGATIHHHFGGAADAGGHCRAPRGGRFHERQRHALVVGSQQYEVTRRVDVGDVGPPTEECHPSGQWCDLGRRSHLAESRAVTGDDELHVGSLRRDARGDSSEPIRSLHSRESTGVHDDEPFCRNTESQAGGSPVERSGDIDARGDHLVLRQLPDVRGQQLVAHLTTDRHDRRRPRGERALGQHDGSRGARREVAVQEVTVEHVDRHRRACRERGEAADHARLGRVGLHDVRTELADLRDHPGKCLRVGERVRCAPEPVDARGGEGARPQHELVDLVVTDPSREQALVEPFGVQIVHEVGDDPGGATDVHPRDDAQHADAVRHGGAP